MLVLLSRESLHVLTNPDIEQLLLSSRAPYVLQSGTLEHQVPFNIQCCMHMTTLTNPKMAGLPVQPTPQLHLQIVGAKAKAQLRNYVHVTGAPAEKSKN